MNIKNFLRKEVINQNGYSTAYPACRIKMDAMENPFPLPPDKRARFMQSIKDVEFNRYPDPGAPEVAAGFAKHFGVEREMIMIGNGSDELIQALCMAFTREDSCVICPSPTFSMYKIISLNNGMDVNEVPLDGNFDLDTEAMLAEVSKKRSSLVFISNPNNPTGNRFTDEKIEKIIKATCGIVVVDEAYFSFSGKTFIPQLARYQNLVILRTLSKVGLASMRIGFLIGDKGLIYELNKVRLPYNINSLSQKAALFFLDEEGFFSEKSAEIVKEREYLFNALKDIDGITPYPSSANFILFSCTFDAYHVYNGLIQRDILIKLLSSLDKTKKYLRVTIGTGDENREFISSLKEVLAEARSVI